MKDNLVRDKSYAFALQVIVLFRKLCKSGEYVLSKQLLRSGTSIGANVEEAKAAQSRADFISKMSIASKVARETNYWLRLLRDSGIIDSSEIDPLLLESDSIIKVLTSIVKSSSITQKSKFKIQNSELPNHSKIQNSKSSAPQ